MLKKFLTIAHTEGFIAAFRRTLIVCIFWIRWHCDEIKTLIFGSYRKRTAVLLNLQFRTPRDIPGVFQEIDCIPERVSQLYLNHYFDLLGSGWVQVSHDMKCRGFEGNLYKMPLGLVPDKAGSWLCKIINTSNVKVAQDVWRGIDGGYLPIDWQIDFKSGFRWSELTWSKRLAYGNRLGVDVKVPWELSRMQHLPQMAIRAAALGVKSIEAQALVSEIRNQCLDFIATNPPGFGVNWICPMDVSIRAANWCITFDILHCKNFFLEDEFEDTLARSIYDHGKYVMRNLEWSSKRGNHYLANICGLVFILSYLPASSEVNSWLLFSISQLEIEVLHQFLRDGGNFEGSTAYHRLSLEMVLYATSIALGLPKDRVESLGMLDIEKCQYFPVNFCILNTPLSKPDSRKKIFANKFSDDYVIRLQNAVTFFSATLKLDGTFPQIGDNDSGRFFKLSPKYSVMSTYDAKRRYINLANYDELSDDDLYFFEEGCYGLDLVESAIGLGFEDSFSYSNRNSCNKIIRFLSDSISLKNSETSIVGGHESRQSNFMELQQILTKNSYPMIKRFKLNAKDKNEVDSIRLFSFPNFGLHIWRSRYVYVALRALEGSFVAKGHFHDDQLSLEITLDGEPLIRDPGTFVYTSLPQDRNIYRNRSAHFPFFDSEEIALSNPFEAPNINPVQNLSIGIDGFAGICNSKERTDHLVFLVSNEEIKIYALSVELGGKKNLIDISRNKINKLPYSPGYGIRENYLH